MYDIVRCEEHNPHLILGREMICGYKYSKEMQICLRGVFFRVSSASPFLAFSFGVVINEPLETGI